MAFRDALALTEDDTRDQVARLTRLGDALLALALASEETEYLNEAAASFRKAADSLAARASDIAESLAGLGMTHAELARRGDRASLPEAIKSLRAALSETPVDDEARPRRLAALADALLLGYQVDGYRGNLTEAAQLLGTAAALPSVEDGAPARYYRSLASVYELRFDSSGDPHDLNSAADAYRNAIANSSDSMVDDLADIELTYANVLTRLNRNGEAANVLRDMSARLADSLGRAAPRTLAARLSLAFALVQSGEAAEAVSVLDDLIPAQARKLGDDHPETRAARELRRTLRGEPRL